MKMKKYRLRNTCMVWEENVITVPADMTMEDVWYAAGEWGQGEWKEIDRDFVNAEVIDVEDVE